MLIRQASSSASQQASTLELRDGASGSLTDAQLQQAAQRWGVDNGSRGSGRADDAAVGGAAAAVATLYSARNVQVLYADGQTVFIACYCNACQAALLSG